MGKLRIPHDSLILVGDGRKALFLRNKGDELHPHFVVERAMRDEPNPSTREQGADRPGRVYGGTSVGTTARRSGVGQTDWHVAEEQHFARHVAGLLEGLIRSRHVHSVVVVAPPRALADLRKAFHPDVRRRILAELDKDLTKHPIDEIEQLLTGP
jgi:protein required for attachment to host cells